MSWQTGSKPTSKPPRKAKLGRRPDKHQPLAQAHRLPASSLKTSIVIRSAEPFAEAQPFKGASEREPAGHPASTPSTNTLARMFLSAKLDER